MTRQIIHEGLTAGLNEGLKVAIRPVGVTLSGNKVNMGRTASRIARVEFWTQCVENQKLAQNVHGLGGFRNLDEIAYS